MSTTITLLVEPWVCSLSSFFAILTDDLTTLGYTVNAITKKAFHVTCDTDLLVCFDQIPPQFVAKRHALVLWECPVVCPGTWNPEDHKRFDALMTWRSDWLHQEHVYPTFFSNEASLEKSWTRLHTPQSWLFQKQKLCALINAHKISYIANELYSKRIRFVRWMEKHHPQDFDLYGQGWGKSLVVVHNGHLPKWVKRLKRWTRQWPESLQRVLLPSLYGYYHYPSYKGPVDDKIATLAAYRFCLCYENAEYYPGYITEKIFDALVAGSVPVYWGAPDITEVVPADCFIDARQLRTPEAIYARLSEMSEVEYLGYLDRIKTFIDNAPVLKGKLTEVALAHQMSQNLHRIAQG
jgi:alpha(1,3/1,4) fucosyltransferase